MNQSQSQSQIQVPQGLFRAGGISMMLSGLIGGSVMALHVEDTPENLAELPHFLTIAVWSHVWLFLAIGLMMFGLTTLFTRQAGRIRWWGWLGFGLMLAAFFFDVCHTVLQMFDYPVLFDGVDTEAKLKEVSDTVMKAQLSMPGNFFMAISGPALLLGTLLTGLALFRAQGATRRPALATLVLFAALLGMFFAPEAYVKILLTCYYLHWAWYGWNLTLEPRQG